MFAMIAATSLNRVIGNNGQIPWNLPDDLNYFNRITRNHRIIMGRLTCLSIGRLLPNRESYILTSQPDSLPFPGIKHLNNWQELSQWQQAAETIFICGGQRPYEAFLPYCQELHLTWVLTELKGDTYFPQFDANEWSLSSFSYHPKDKKHIYPFVIGHYMRKNTPQVFTSNQSIV